MANWGLQGAASEWNGFTVYPSDGAMGNKALGTFMNDFQADCAIFLCDAWILTPETWPDNLHVGVWAPVDHYPLPPAVFNVLQHPKVTPIAMSRFGEGWMRKFKLEPLYVPHGVDTSVFRPQPEIRDAVRDALEIPRDAFLVGMVAANKSTPVSRKSFPQAFDAFARFAKNHDDAYMYVHTSPTPHQGGINLDTLARAVHCPPGKIRFTPDKSWHKGVPRQAVAYTYQAFDVLLNPSMGEGFGVPILEAQACGVPVITSNHSAMTELSENGWCVEGDRWWDSGQDSFLICPSINEISKALEGAYELRGNQQLRDNAAAFADGYDADLVTAEYWEPALEKLIAPKVVPARNGNRAQRRAKRKVAA